MTTSGGGGKRDARTLILAAVDERPVPDLRTLGARLGVTGERARQLLVKHGVYPRWQSQRRVERATSTLNKTLSRKRGQRNGAELRRLVDDAVAHGLTVRSTNASVTIEGGPVRVHVVAKSYAYGEARAAARYFHIHIKSRALHVVVFPDKRRYFVLPDEIGPRYRYFREGRLPAERWPTAARIREAWRAVADESAPEAGAERGGGGCGGEEKHDPRAGPELRETGADTPSDRGSGGAADT